MAEKIVRVSCILPKDVVVKTTTSESKRTSLALSAADEMVERVFRDFMPAAERRTVTEAKASFPTVLEFEIPVGSEEAVARALSQAAKELRGL